MGFSLGSILATIKSPFSGEKRNREDSVMQDGRPVQRARTNADKSYASAARPAVQPAENGTGAAPAVASQLIPEAEPWEPAPRHGPGLKIMQGRAQALRQGSMAASWQHRSDLSLARTGISSIGNSSGEAHLRSVAAMDGSMQTPHTTSRPQAAAPSAQKAMLPTQQPYWSQGSVPSAGAAAYPQFYAKYEFMQRQHLPPPAHKPSQQVQRGQAKQQMTSSSGLPSSQAKTPTLQLHHQAQRQKGSHVRHAQPGGQRQHSGREERVQQQQQQQQQQHWRRRSDTGAPADYASFYRKTAPQQLQALERRSQHSGSFARQLAALGPVLLSADASFTPAPPPSARQPMTIDLSSLPAALVTAAPLPGRPTLQDPATRLLEEQYKQRKQEADSSRMQQSFQVRAQQIQQLLDEGVRISSPAGPAPGAAAALQEAPRRALEAVGQGLAQELQREQRRAAQQQRQQEGQAAARPAALKLGRQRQLQQQAESDVVEILDDSSEDIQGEEQEEEEVEEDYEDDEYEEEAEGGLGAEQGGPFAVTAQEQETWHVALSGGPEQQVLLQHACGIEVTRKHVQCMRLGQWLNDEVVNVFMAMLQDRDTLLRQKCPSRYPKCHYFNSFFINKLYKDGGQYSYDNVRRWTAPGKLKRANQASSSILEVDKVVIPVHQTMHWVCAVIDLGARRVTYYDSLKGRDDKLLQCLVRYICDEYQNKGKDPAHPGLDPANWSTCYCRECPQQLNGYDCGVFTLKAAEYAGLGRPWDYGQQHMDALRQKTVAQIMAGALELPPE